MAPALTQDSQPELLLPYLTTPPYTPSPPSSSLVHHHQRDSNNTGNTTTGSTNSYSNMDDAPTGGLRHIHQEQEHSTDNFDHLDADTDTSIHHHHMHSVRLLHHHHHHNDKFKLEFDQNTTTSVGSPSLSRPITLNQPTPPHSTDSSAPLSPLPGDKSFTSKTNTLGDTDTKLPSPLDYTDDVLSPSQSSDVSHVDSCLPLSLPVQRRVVIPVTDNRLDSISFLDSAIPSPSSPCKKSPCEAALSDIYIEEQDQVLTTVAPSPQLDDFPSATTTDTTTSTDNIDTTTLGQDKKTLTSTGLVAYPVSQSPPPLPELHVSFSSPSTEEDQEQLPQSETVSVTGMGGTIGEVEVSRVTGRSAAPQPNDTPPPPPPPPPSLSPISFSLPDSSEIIHTSMILGGKMVTPTSLLPNNTNGPVLSEMVSHGSIVMPVTNGDMLYDNLLPTLPDDFFKSLNNLVTNNPELLDQLNPSNTFTDASSLTVPADTPALGSMHQHQDVTPTTGVFTSSAAVGVKHPPAHAPVMTPEQQAAAFATSLSVRQLRLQKRQAQLLRRVRRVTGRGLAAVVSTQLQHLLSHGPTLLRREGRAGDHDHEADLASTDVDAVALSAAGDESAVPSGDGVHQPPRYDTRALRAMSTANLITYVRRMETRSTTTTTTSTSNTISDTSHQPSNYSTSHLYSSTEAPVCNSYNSITSKYSVAQPCLPESVRAELDTFVGEVSAAARLHVEHDSDATESSSGGESCDELDGYDDENNTDHKPICDRALYRHCSERAWIASRWTWLQAQLTDLECKIHQHNRAHMRLRHMSRSGSKGDLLTQHLLQQQQTSLSGGGSIGVPGFLPSPAQLHRPSYTCLTRTTNINGFSTGVAAAGAGTGVGGGGGADGTTSFSGAGHHYVQGGTAGDEGETSARTAGYRWHRKRRWIRVGNVFERGPACSTAGAAEARYSDKYGRTIRQPTFVAPCNCVYPYSCILCTRLSVKASSSVVQSDRNFIMNTCSNNNINYNNASISCKLQSPAAKMPPPILPPFSTISSSKSPSGQCSLLSPSSQSPPSHITRSPYNHHSFTTNITFNNSNVERNLCKSFGGSNSSINTNTTNCSTAGTPLKTGTSSFTTTTTTATLSDGTSYPYDSSSMNRYGSFGGTPYKTPSKSRPLNAVGMNSGGCITSLCKSAWFPRVAASSRTTLNRSAQRVPCQEKMGACDPAYHPVLTHATEIPQSTRLETILKSRTWLQKLPGLYKFYTSPSKSGVHPCIKDESPSISGSSSVCTSTRHHGTDYTEEGSSGIGLINSRSYHRRTSHSKKKKKNKDKDRGRSRDKETKRKDKKKKGYKRRDKEAKKGRLTLRLRKSSVTGELVPTYGETSRGTDSAHRYLLESSESPHDPHHRGCVQSSGSAYCDDSSSVCSSRASSPAPQFHQRGSSVAPQSLHGHQHRGTSHPCAGDKGVSAGGSSSKTAATTPAYHYWDSSKVAQRGVASHHESGTATSSGKLSVKTSLDAATTSSVVVVPAPNSSAYSTRRASLYAGTGSTTTSALTGAGGVGAGGGSSSCSLQLTPAAAAAVAFKNKQSTASYDIDNIVIPYNMASVTRVEHIEYKEIVTPKWREVEELQPLDTNDACLLEEDVTTPCVLARHARSEELERLRFAAHLSGGGGRHGGNARTRQRSSMGGPGSAHGGQGTSTGTNTPDNPLSPHTDVADMVSPIVTPPATPLPMSEDSNQSSTCSVARTQCRGANNSSEPTKQEEENSNVSVNKTASATTATTTTTSSGGKVSSCSTLVMTTASNQSDALPVTTKAANSPIVIFSPFLSELKKNNLAAAKNNSASCGGGSSSDMEADISSCGTLGTKTIVATDQLAASSTNKCNNTDNCSSVSTSSSANRKLRSTNAAPRQRSISNGPAAAADEDGVSLEQVSPYPSRRFPLSEMAYATMLRENSEATVAQPPRHTLLTSIDYDRMGDSSDDDDDKNEDEDDGNCEDNNDDDDVAVTQSKTKRKVPDGGVTPVAPGAKRRNSSRSFGQQQHAVLTNYTSNKTAVCKQNDNIGDTALIKLSGSRQSVEQLRRSSVSLREHINKVGCIDGGSEGRSSPLSEVTDSAAEDDLTGELMLDDTATPRPPDWTISATADAAGRCVMQVLRH